MGIYYKAAYTDEPKSGGAEFTLPNGLHDFDIFLNGNLLLRNEDYEVRNGILYLQERLDSLDVLLLMPYTPHNQMAKPIYLYGLSK